MNGEEWRSVVGWEGWYEVSDLGRVRRIAPAMNLTGDGLLSLRWDGKHQYARVSLWRNNRGQQYPVHVLVAKAFIGLPPTDRHEVNHKDLDKANNKATNLEWMTGQENTQHAAAAGRMSRHGASNHFSREYPNA